jgi:hypothetical protein
MLLLGAILGGCHASPWATTKTDSPGTNAAADVNKADANKNGSETNAAKNNTNATASSQQKNADPPGNSVAGSSTNKSAATATAASTVPGAENSAATAQSLQEVMAEVRELGVLDPQQQSKLLEDLRQTDPALWPLMVKQVRAVVAYRRKSTDHSQTAAQGAMFASVPGSNLPRGAAASLYEEEEDSQQVLPQSSKTAKSKLKDDLTPPLPSDDVPSVATTHVASNRKISGTRSAPAISHDLQSLDVKSHNAEDRVTPASYESPLPQNETTKAGSVAKAATDSANGNPPEEQTAGGDWHGMLDQTIKALEAETSEKPKTAEDLAKHARLRMLYAAAGRREDASKPIPTAPPAMQDFWTKELYGLSVLMDTERSSDAMSRSAEAKQHLSEGFTRLGQMASLVVRNASFCTVVQSYGCYTPFKKYEFLPDQEVLLYAEVENFGIESTPKGYHTALRSSYQILDKSGQRIADRAMSTTEEYCQNPRRDFFIGYQLRMPTRINPGSYTLQLTIEDLKSQKVGQASVELTIKGSEREKPEK